MNVIVPEVCPQCTRRWGRIESDQTNVCIRCGWHAAGVRCANGHRHPTVTEADNCREAA